MTITEAITKLQHIDAERREVANALAPEAKRRGVATDGRDPLYQGWCLLGQSNGAAVSFLREAGES